MTVRTVAKPSQPVLSGMDENGWLGSSTLTTLPVASVEGHGVRLYGSAMVDGVQCWYHPPTDRLVPAARWDEWIAALEGGVEEVTDES